MTWLVGWKTYRSEKNGRIRCRRLFGRWDVYVGGFHESSRYLEAIWRDAYARLPDEFAPRRVLLLGLAAGDNVRLLHERWPAARVTAVEWDPVMVRLADELRTYPPEWRPEIIVEDAARAVTALSGPYDLILVDLFKGAKVAPAVLDREFYGHIARLLAPDGFAFVNAFLQAEALGVASARLQEIARWRSRHNRLGLFARPSV